MAFDTVDSVVGKVRLRIPNADDLLLLDWIVNGFRDASERRDWSWLVAQGQIDFPDVYATGSVTIVQGENSVAITGGEFTPDMVGLQLRAGNTTPIRTIVTYEDSTHVTLDKPWLSASVTNTSFEVYRAYITVPDNFKKFISVIDPQQPRVIGTSATAADIDRVDPQRTRSGLPEHLCFLDYSPDAFGRVDAVLQAIGAGNAPTAGGAYSGPNDALFIVQVALGGAPGTATFVWKKDSGAFSSAVTTSASPTALRDDVTIAFPALNYTLGDVFVIRCTASTAPGLPRYEVWPHVKQRYVLPFLMLTVPSDLTEPNAAIPRYLRGDILLELALAEAAKWPGEEGRPNPYYRLSVSESHRVRAESMLATLDRNDENIYLKSLQYDGANAGAYMMDDAYLQSHAFSGDGDD